MTALPRGATGLDQQAELERAGRYALRRYGYARLATMMAVVYSALVQLQKDGVRGAEAVDADEVENLGALFHRLDAEGAGAVA